MQTLLIESNRVPEEVTTNDVGSNPAAPPRQQELSSSPLEKQSPNNPGGIPTAPPCLYKISSLYRPHRRALYIGEKRKG